MIHNSPAEDSSLIFVVKTQSGNLQNEIEGKGRNKWQLCRFRNDCVWSVIDLCLFWIPVTFEILQDISYEIRVSSILFFARMKMVVAK